MADERLDGLNVAILVADGFEEGELTEPREALDQAGADTNVVSPKADRVRSWNFTDWGSDFPVDVPLEEADPDDFDEEELIDGERAKLSILTPGEQFLYEFDFGDGWLHLCTVGTVQIDPDSQLGIRPATPPCLLACSIASRIAFWIGTPPKA